YRWSYIHQPRTWISARRSGDGLLLCCDHPVGFDPGLPDLLQATFPARRQQYEAKNRSHRAWHMWEAVGESAQEPLIRLLPYLRIRRRQAELALSLITLMQSDKAGSARPLSEEQQQARRLLYEQVRSLNASRPQQTYR